MLILALESSAKPASVAICRDGELLCQYFHNSGLTHSRTLMKMTEDLLGNLGIPISSIELIAVSSGPGSFTGVRIGVSAVKGLAWGLGLKVCGVSTLEAMTYQTPIYDAIICPVMNARRAQVYNALFEWKDGAPVRLTDDRVISLKELADELRSACSVHSAQPAHFAQPTRPASPASLPPRLTDPRTVYLVGDGAEMSYGFLSAEGIPCRLAPELLRYQTAYGVALAAHYAVPISAIDLEPKYLRPSQAERERLG